MDKLESPNKFAGFAAQCDYRVGPLVIAGAQAAVVIRTGASSGDEEQVAFLVHNHNGPGVSGTAAPARAFAFSCGSGGIRRKGIPAPTKSAGARVVSADDSASHIHAMIVVNGRADHDEIVNDGGRGSHVIPAGIVMEDVPQADLTFFAKIGTGRAADSIHCNKTRVLRGLE